MKNVNVKLSSTVAKVDVCTNKLEGTDLNKELSYYLAGVIFTDQPERMAQMYDSPDDFGDEIHRYRMSYVKDIVKRCVNAKAEGYLPKKSVYQNLNVFHIDNDMIANTGVLIDARRGLKFQPTILADDVMTLEEMIEFSNKLDLIGVGNYCIKGAVPQQYITDSKFVACWHSDDFVWSLDNEPEIAYLVLSSLWKGTVEVVHNAYRWNDVDSLSIQVKQAFHALIGKGGN